MKEKKSSFLLMVFGCCCLLTLLTISAVYAQEISLQDDSLLVAFDSRSGAFTRMERKSTHWIIERRPALGTSFKMFVPLPQRNDNFILGQKQKAKVEKLSNHQLRIQWNRLVSEHGSVLPITFTAVVTLNGGQLTFNATVENNSNLTVETISYPYFGDFCPPSANSSMRIRTEWYDNLESDEIYPHFGNEKGYWGVFYPEKTFDSKHSLFCLIQSAHQGLYVDMADATQPYLLQYTFVQKPGVLSSINNLVPRQDSISGHPVHLEFRACHFIYARPHSIVKLAPVVLQCYNGNWHAGIDLYKKWRKTWFHPASLPEWIKEVNSWQQLQINSPVQDYRVHYDQLVKYGAECARNGVRAIQLVGWNKGGQDGGDPSLNTDPGLGTWQQLHDAIQKIQAMGVKIILFAKLNWADRTTEWTKKELYKYAATDPYSIPYEQGGYSYYTPTELAGIDQHRRYVMDILDPAYQKIAVKEFKKTLALGAAGWLWDEVLQHASVNYSFNYSHGYMPPGYIYSGDMPLAQELHDVTNKINPDFLFAGEGPQDWLMQYYPASYFRINYSSTPVERYIDPYAPLMVAVSGFDDREMLNLILMDRYIISYEPYYFKGHLEDFPLTLAYGKKIDSLRRRYKKYLWNAEFKDTEGASVTANAGMRYSVFVTKKGKRCVVVINPSVDKAITAKVMIPHANKLMMATPEHPDEESTSGILNIPARSAAVVMEQ